MKKKAKPQVYITDKMVVTAICLAGLYWVVETVLFIFLGLVHGVQDWLFGPEQTGMYPRLIVLCMFVIFGAHAQYNIKLRKENEVEVVSLRKELEALKKTGSSSVETPC